MKNSLEDQSFLHYVVFLRISFFEQQFFTICVEYTFSGFARLQNTKCFTLLYPEDPIHIA